MRHLKDSILAAALIGATIGFISCDEQIRTDPELTVQVEENHPMEMSPPAEDKIQTRKSTLEEPNNPSIELDSPTGPVADNSRCYACHLNFKKEELTLVHAQANIGCTQCHGASDAHRLDEDTITPPDVMYPKAKIKSFCISCHTGESMNIQAHESIIAEADPLNGRCTDCHGEHRLNYRTRKWDKFTRNLIKDDRVLRLSDEIPKQ